MKRMTEMKEDNLGTLYSSFNLKSFRFIALHINRGENCPIKKFNVYFQINWFLSFYLSITNFVVHRERSESRIRITQLRINKIRKKNEDPEFIKNYLES